MMIQKIAQLFKTLKTITSKKTTTNEPRNDLVDAMRYSLEIAAAQKRTIVIDPAAKKEIAGIRASAITFDEITPIQKPYSNKLAYRKNKSQRKNWHHWKKRIKK